MSVVEKIRITSEMADDAALITNAVLSEPWFAPMDEVAQRAIVDFASSALSFYKDSTEGHGRVLRAALSTAVKNGVDGLAVQVALKVVSQYDTDQR